MTLPYDPTRKSGTNDLSREDVERDKREREAFVREQREDLERDMYKGMREPWDGAEPDREPMSRTDWERVGNRSGKTRTVHHLLTGQDLDAPPLPPGASYCHLCDNDDPYLDPPCPICGGAGIDTRPALPELRVGRIAEDVEP